MNPWSALVGTKAASLETTPIWSVACAAGCVRFWKREGRVAARRLATPFQRFNTEQPMPETGRSSRSWECAVVWVIPVLRRSITT